MTTSETEYTKFSTAADQRRGPATERPCPGAAHSTHPSRIPWDHQYGARNEGAGRSDDSSRESWIWQRVMVAGAFNEGRNGGFERQHAMLCQMYRILESGAKDNGHDLVWGWPLLGLSDPDARPSVHWSPAKASAVIAWHREAAALERAKKQLMTPTGKATPKLKSEHPSDDDDNLQNQIRAVVKQTLQAKQQGQGGKGGKAKDGGAN